MKIITIEGSQHNGEIVQQMSRSKTTAQIFVDNPKLESLEENDYSILASLDLKYCFGAHISRLSIILGQFFTFIPPPLLKPV
jgi:hypothetical protein